MSNKLILLFFPLVQGINLHTIKDFLEKEQHQYCGTVNYILLRIRLRIVLYCTVESKSNTEYQMPATGGGGTGGEGEAEPEGEPGSEIEKCF